MTEEEHDHLLSQYDGGVTYINFHLGKLVTRLKELRLYENSLIIITSDHGEAFGERNLVEHTVSVYQDQIYIPLIIKYPNIDQQKVVYELVSVIDLAPTIMDVLNCKTPNNIQGKSLMKLELGKYRSVMSESYLESHMIKWHDRFNRVERAIFLEPYKFVCTIRYLQVSLSGSQERFGRKSNRDYDD